MCDRCMYTMYDSQSCCVIYFMKHYKVVLASDLWPVHGTVWYQCTDLYTQIYVRL